jgi:N-acetylglutamate synthase-like GNAT family acetyltransferase
MIPNPELLQESTTPPKQLTQELGHTGLGSGVEVDIVHTPLPDGYHYAEAAGIDPGEVIALVRQPGIEWDVDDDEIQMQRTDARANGLTLQDVGVRDSDHSLVGFGSLAFRGEYGELGNFVVSPAHQSKGIGKAIIDARLAMADAAGITSLYIAPLEPTNTLRSYYAQKGFHETPAGEMVRGPHPIPLTFEHSEASV